MEDAAHRRAGESTTMGPRHNSCPRELQYRQQTGELKMKAPAMVSNASDLNYLAE